MFIKTNNNTIYKVKDLYCLQGYKLQYNDSFRYYSFSNKLEDFDGIVTIDTTCESLDKFNLTNVGLNAWICESEPGYFREKSEKTEVNCENKEKPNVSFEDFDNWQPSSSGGKLFKRKITELETRYKNDRRNKK